MQVVELIPTDFAASYPDVLQSDAGNKETVLLIPADDHALYINFKVTAHLNGFLVVLSLGADVDTRVIVKGDV